MNRRLVGNFQNALWLRRQKLSVGESCLSRARLLEMRLDGFAERGKPYGWAAIEQGTAERHSLLQVGSWT
jgi:hypothetical protein